MSAVRIGQMPFVEAKRSVEASIAKDLAKQLPTITGKTVKVGTKSFSSMEEELRQIHARISAEQEIPKGAFTAKQYAKANGLGEMQAYMTCKRAVGKGLMEAFSLRSRCDNGDIRMQKFFRMVR